ncbi:hypothetical protein SDC9_111588 [bioreactor metagenome]|uniref:Uncharacterized protein n=1 Tax=bioreactor metagenome TaxID=1076179 RepID=A0A645BGW5_9ZZZZ
MKLPFSRTSAAFTEQRWRWNNSAFNHHPVSIERIFVRKEYPALVDLARLGLFDGDGAAAG